MPAEEPAGADHVVQPDQDGRPAAIPGAAKREFHRRLKVRQEPAESLGVGLILLNREANSLTGAGAESIGPKTSSILAVETGSLGRKHPVPAMHTR